MPEKILELLEKGSLTNRQIAETLGISMEEVKACITYLSNMGFIKSIVINPTGDSCSGSCGSCGSCSSCKADSSSSYTAWEVI